MVYGRILYNNIKEYTPKWFATIPYSQTVKPTFTRKPQVESLWSSNPTTKTVWKIFGATIQRNSWAWQTFIFCLSFGFFFMIYQPFLYVYRKNNQHRTYQAAMIKQRAHKKKLKALQQAALAGIEQ